MRLFKTLALLFALSVGTGGFTTATTIPSETTQEDSVIFQQDFVAFAIYDVVPVAREHFQFVLKACEDIPSRVTLYQGGNAILLIGPQKYNLQAIGVSEDKKDLYLIDVATGDKWIFTKAIIEGKFNLILDKVSEDYLYRLMVEKQTCDLKR